MCTDAERSISIPRFLHFKRNVTSRRVESQRTRSDEKNDIMCQSKVYAVAFLNQ